MNYQAPSRHTAISNTGGLVDLQTCLEKWWWRSQGTGLVVTVSKNEKLDNSFNVIIWSACCIVLQKVSMLKKVHVIYNFFFVRKIVAHMVTFVFYCVVIPATVLVPEVVIPKWGAIYIPSVITLLNAVGTPRFWQIISDFIIVGFLLPCTPFFFYLIKLFSDHP